MGYRVLIVDDEEEVLDLLQSWLELRGYEVYTAMDGKQGLRALYEHRPDLVISDVAMPEMDGYEFCAIVRYMSDLPIVMLTGLARLDEDSGNLHRLNLGVDAILGKPLTMNKLLDTIESLIARHAASTSAAGRGGHSQIHAVQG